MSEAFPNASGRGIRIGVADSGINPNHPQVGEVAGGIGFRFRDGKVEKENDFTDRLSHGTAVAATIRGRAPEAELYGLRIFGRRLVTHAETLLAAVEWAAEQRLHLLNLSLGCTNESWRDAFEQACQRAAQAGVIVVAAAEAEGKPSLPGCLSLTLGVKSDSDLPRDDYRYVQENGRVDFFASPWAHELPELAREKNFHGSSLAVANLTGIAARALQLHRPTSVPELKRILCANQM